MAVDRAPTVAICVALLAKTFEIISAIRKTAITKTESLRIILSSRIWVRVCGNAPLFPSHKNENGWEIFTSFFWFLICRILVCIVLQYNRKKEIVNFFLPYD